MRRFEIVEGREVVWGWLEGGSDPTAPTIAAINTFGAPSKNIPARDTVTPTVQIVAGAVSEMAVAAGRDIAAGRDPSGLLEGLALVIEAEHREQIRAFNSPGNAPSTIAKKGRDDPLIGADGAGRILKGASAEVRSTGG